MAVRDGRGNGEAPRGASVVMLAPGAVLMVLRANPPFEDLWSFPGGRSEAGETAEETARRELLEETGLTAARLVTLGSFRPAPERSPMTLSVFAARSEGGAARAGDDASEAAFVPLAAVLERRTTARAAGWIARALAALSDPPLG